LVQHTKTGKNTPIDQKICIPNGHITLQMAIKCTNLFNSKTLQNIPNMGFFGYEKIYHLATPGWRQQKSACRSFYGLFRSSWVECQIGADARKEIILTIFFESRSPEKKTGIANQSLEPGPDVLIFKFFSPKNVAKKLPFLTQNKAKLCKTLIIIMYFLKNANIFCRKLA
jgi:hypothetical protein